MLGSQGGHGLPKEPGSLSSLAAYMINSWSPDSRKPDLLYAVPERQSSELPSWVSDFLRKAMRDYWGDFGEQNFEQPSPTQGRLYVNMNANHEPLDEYFDLTMMAIGLDRRAFVTKSGIFGFGTKELETGDLVCVLNGGRLPFILRRAARNAESYILIGNVYMLDFEPVRVTSHFEGYSRQMIPQHKVTLPGTAWDFRL